MVAVDYKDTMIVYDEYNNMTGRQYDLMAVRTGKMIVGGLMHEDYVAAYVTYGGKYKLRTKIHLTTGEIRDGKKTLDTEMCIIEMGGVKVLPILCYELLFPEDYYHLKPDIITHHVGYPMFDRHQYGAWYGLQKAAVEHFQVPMISVTGGMRSKLALTHILDP